MHRIPGWNLGRPKVPLASRLVVYERTRFGITALGIGFAVLLMLFLLGIYAGVRTECNGWVAGRAVDAWVAQDNTTNFVRSASYMRSSRVATLRDVPGVTEVSQLMRLITSLDVRGTPTTAFVIGIEPGSTAGRPTVTSGSDDPKPGGIIVDRALARRLGLALGDSLSIQGRPFRVQGLSVGTNAIITQFTFITLADARQLFGIPDVTNFALVRAAPGADRAVLLRAIRERVTGTNVFTQAAFAANNLAELRTGLLPILATIAFFGAVVGMAVLTLLLYSSILERREDYALLKAIGAPSRFLASLVMRQSLFAVASGLVTGLAAYLALTPLAVRLVPALVLSLSPLTLAAVALTALLMGIVGALWPLARVNRIYPAEVFRA
jgi:putative ABC transport system permease protein